MSTASMHRVEDVSPSPPPPPIQNRSRAYAPMALMALALADSTGSYSKALPQQRFVVRESGARSCMGNIPRQFMETRVAAYCQDKV